MAQPQPYTRTRWVTLAPNRFLWIIAGICFLIAALTDARVVGIGPWIAWALGGIASWFFSYVV
jgi:hypothetical protein